MATCDIQTTNREYMISKGALQSDSRKVANERLFDFHNEEIRDIANQRYNLSTTELPFTKRDITIPRDKKQASDFFIEWSFNDKFYEQVRPRVEFVKDIEALPKVEGVIPTYRQEQISFAEMTNEDLIVEPSPIRATFPYEAEDYLEDVLPETKSALNKLKFKEESCGL